ncbi:MAG: glycosyltransferase family 4 protein [Candidatus Komeilibacteria bacterium]
MKITLLTMEYPPMIGGVGNYYAGLVKHLERENIKVRIIVLPNKMRWWQVLWKIIWLKADYLWIGQILPIGTAAYLMHKIRHQQYFVSLHGMDINLALAAKPTITQKILANATFITANSEYTKNLIGASIANKKVVIIYPSPNINEQIDPAIEQTMLNQFKLKDNRVLLSVCRLVERKGLQQVIALMPQLLKNDPTLIYYIIGNGEYQSELERLIVDHKLTDHVVILNNINNEELKIFYLYANLFIMPTIDIKGDVEGFGIVYLEAGLYNTPVIATPVGGAKEAVIDKQTGILCTAEELLSNIVRLLTDQDYANKLGKQASELIKAKYSYSKQINKLVNQLVDGRR